MKKLWLLSLYPRAWRRRYGAEFLALLEDVSLSPRTIADCLLGAVDAHLRRHVSEGGTNEASAIESAFDGVPNPSLEATGPAPVVRPPLRLHGPGSTSYETAIDRILREAQERGEFDDLPGTGKPLQLQDENPSAGDWAMAFRVLKEAGETLPWIALGKEIDADRASLQARLDRASTRLAGLRGQATTPEAIRGYESVRARYRAEYLEEAARLDQKLARFNLNAPSWRLDRGRFPPRLAAQRFDSACPPLPTDVR